MRIETEIKLDFKDVLIRPKRSTLTSRKEVDLFREFNFRNVQQEILTESDATHKDCYAQSSRYCCQT